MLGLRRLALCCSSPLGLSVGALGGCGMSSLTSGLGGGMFGGGFLELRSLYRFRRSTARRGKIVRSECNRQYSRR